MSDSGNAALPPGWAWARLGTLGGWTGGGTPSKANSSFWNNGLIPWVSPKDMKADRVGQHAERITKAAVRASATKIVPRGSVLCVIRSGILQHTFPVALAQCRVSLNQDMRALTTFDGIVPRYIQLYLQLQNDRLLHQCSKDGTTVASINVDQLREFGIPVPPHPEQLRIVTTVDALLDEVDEVEATMKRARERMADYRASLLHAACTGALTADWRAANPNPEEDGPALLRRILAERRAAWERAELARLTKGGKPLRGESWKGRYAEPILPDASGLPALPPGWVWATLDQLTHRITSGSRDWGTKYAEDGPMLLRAQDLKTDNLVLGAVARVRAPKNGAEERTRVFEGDLLITITGANVTKAARVAGPIGHAYVSQHVGLCRPVLSALSAFLHLVVISESFGRAYLKAAAYGAGKPGLNLLDLAEMVVPLPPLAEQSFIIQVLAETDAASGAPETDDLRQSILYAAFSGRLVQQDSADEPATVLIARIQAEAPAVPRRRSARAGARP